MRRLLIALVAPIIAVALTLSVSPANAAHHHRGYKVPAARSHILGGCAHNKKTHVLSCISGYHKDRHKARGKTRTFYWPTFSSQRCNHGECHGHIWKGEGPHLYRPGYKGRVSSKDTSGCGGVFSPWAICWADRQISSMIKKVNDHVVKPCIIGGGSGFGGTLATNVAVQEMFRGGAITAAQFGKYFTGPVGIAVISIGTCTSGVWAKGLSDLGGIFGT